MDQDSEEIRPLACSDLSPCAQMKGWESAYIARTCTFSDIFLNPLEAAPLTAHALPGRATAGKVEQVACTGIECKLDCVLAGAQDIEELNGLTGRTAQILGGMDQKQRCGDCVG